MGREKQPERRKLSPPPKDYIIRTGDQRGMGVIDWSEKWKDRAAKAADLSDPNALRFFGPPKGIPTGRSGGGHGPTIQEGSGEKQWPDQLWTQKHEAKYRLGLIDDEGKPLPGRPVGEWGRDSLELRRRFGLMGDIQDSKIEALLKTREGHEALTREGTRELKQREIQRLRAAALKDKDEQARVKAARLQRRWDELRAKGIKG